MNGAILGNGLFYGLRGVNKCSNGDNGVVYFLFSNSFGTL